MDAVKQAEINAIVELMSAAEVGQIVMKLLGDFYQAATLASVADENAARVFNDGIQSRSHNEFLLGSQRSKVLHDEKRTSLAQATEASKAVVAVLSSVPALQLLDNDWRFSLATAIRWESEELSRVFNAKPVIGGVAVDELNRRHETVAGLAEHLRKWLDEGQQKNGSSATPRRRNNNARVLLTSRILTHHGYEHGHSVSNSEPILPEAMRGTGESRVSKGSVSNFFRDHFGSYDQYVHDCQDQKTLASKLAQLADEWSTAAGGSVSSFTSS